MTVSRLIEVIAEAQQFGGVVREGGSGLPLEVVCADGNGVDSHLDTLVAHLTDVGPGAGIEVGRHGHVILPKHIDGLLAIEIDATPDAVAEHSEVDTDVILGALLPLQVGVRVLVNLQTLFPGSVVIVVR